MRKTASWKLMDPLRLNDVFREQRAAFSDEPLPSVAQRRGWLADLERCLSDHRADIAAAISADFGHRPAAETNLLELFPSIETLRYARRNVEHWMRPERRAVSRWFLPGKAEVRYQPLGVVGVIVPWNYPLYLSIGPLASALAAGNRIMIKLSEYASRFGELFASIIAAKFQRDLIAVVNGNVDVARAFTALPFDHLLFTGSTAVGKQVMTAAARNLTPVTLELGGKSPTIVAPDFDLSTAARRIMFGKLINAGQTCLAPDYVLAPADTIEALVTHMRSAAQSLYGSVASADYASIINDRHYERLTSLLDDARMHGARIEPLLDAPEASLPRRLPPALVLGGTESMRIMRQEIFGPLLLIVAYRTLDEAIRYVNERPRPLALYVFDDDRRRRDDLLARTASGGVTINDTILHVGQDDLPFGGVGPSGMGRYHGLEGFRTFSQVRSVFRQRRLNATSFLYPPYDSAFKRRIMSLMLRRR